MRIRWKSINIMKALSKEKNSGEAQKYSSHYKLAVVFFADLLLVVEDLVDDRHWNVVYFWNSLLYLSLRLVKPCQLICVRETQFRRGTSVIRRLIKKVTSNNAQFLF